LPHASSFHGSLRLNEASIQRLEVEPSLSPKHQRASGASPSHDSTNFYLAIEQLHHIPLAVKLQTKEIIRQMEQQIRAKRREVQQKRLEVKQAAETLADAFDQKRKLKRAAKKIMLAAQGPDMGSRDGSPLLSDTASPPRLEKDELETHPQ